MPNNEFVGECVTANAAAIHLSWVEYSTMIALLVSKFLYLFVYNFFFHFLVSKFPSIYLYDNIITIFICLMSAIFFGPNKASVILLFLIKSFVLIMLFIYKTPLITWFKNLVLLG